MTKVAKDWVLSKSGKQASEKQAARRKSEKKF
jgi:hypothetical protein